MKYILLTILLMPSIISLGQQTNCLCGQESFYTWDENGTPQTVTFDPACPSDSGTYVVTVTDACGNTGTDSHIINICTAGNLSINTAFYTGSAQICLLFGNNPTCCDNPQYEWIDPCGSIVSTTRFLNPPDITVCGIYTLNLISCNGCTECSDSETIDIQIGGANTPDCCGGTCGCVSCTANITSFTSVASCNTLASYAATSCTGATLSWDATLGGSSVATGGGANFSFTPSIDGTYTITLTVLDECNVTTTTSVTTTVSNCGTGCQDCTGAMISANNTPTCNSPTTFSIPCSNTSSFNWSITGGGGTVSGNTLTYTPTTTGTYQVDVTFVDQCNNPITDFFVFTVTCTVCADCTDQQITANNTPTCDDPTIFNINCAGSATVSWSITGGGGSSAGTNFTYTPTASGSYTVTAIVTDDCNNMFTRTYAFTVTCVACDCTISLLYDEPNCEMDYIVTGCDSWQLRKGINAACNGVTTVASGSSNANGSYDICNGLGDGFYNLVGLENGCPLQQSACLESDCCCVSCQPSLTTSFICSPCQCPNSDFENTSPSCGNPFLWVFNFSGGCNIANVELVIDYNFGYDILTLDSWNQSNINIDVDWDMNASFPTGTPTCSNNQLSSESRIIITTDCGDIVEYTLILFQC